MCEDCDWESLLDDIEEMLDELNFEFAIDTLEGIKKWVVDNEHCTEAQTSAVNNISNSVHEY